MYCFKPAINNLPTGEWVCPRYVSFVIGYARCVVCNLIDEDETVDDNAFADLSNDKFLLPNFYFCQSCKNATYPPPHQTDKQQALNTSLQPQAQGNFQSNIGATNDKFDNNVKLLNKPKIAEEYRNTKRKAVKEDNTGNSVSTAKLEVKTNTQDSDSNSPIASKEKTVTKSVLTGDMFANLKFR